MIGFSNNVATTRQGGLFKTLISVFLGGIAIFLLLSFISYLYVGNEDCRINERTIIDLFRNHAHIKNYCGIMGARAAYFFMFRGIGISAFIIVFFFLFLYCKILGLRFVEKIGLAKVLVLCILAIISSSLLLWYFFKERGITSLGFCVGEMNLSLGDMCVRLLGRGSTFFVFIFAILCSSLIIEINLFNKILLGLFFSLRYFFSFLLFLFLKIKNFFIFIFSCIKSDNNTNKDKDFKSYGSKNSVGDEKHNIPSFVPSSSSTPQKNSKNFFPGIDNNVEPIPSLEIEDRFDVSGYKKPGLDLLKTYDVDFSIPEEEKQNVVNCIMSTFLAFKINVQFVDVVYGPAMGLYEFIPDMNIKISNIRNLEDNLCVALSTAKVSVIAPIPGKNTVGIAVPNSPQKTLSLKNILKEAAEQIDKYSLPIVLGKDVFNSNIVVDLAKMPHMIVAGATGQGKSVGLNVIISSLLFFKNPDELKFILIDPKKVEFSLFEEIKDFFIAGMDGERMIITDLNKTSSLFEMLCKEMDERYELLKQHFVKNIKEYNSLPKIKKMQYIVVVVDEFADLMLQFKEGIEKKIVRLSQLSRAVGIHLIIATQRPSVNIITGLIKANFPVRVAYKVASKVDSMTILDNCGAENLLGNGDAIVFIDSVMKRFQTPYISTEEIRDICSYIHKQK